ncbi:VOC family protein [Streptomyces sp. NRRL B-24085]|uniref:VOC family protein n=1 Tax=Streptomyces sp. NRRL B-24085 TaxID=1709476 RepID=UPI00358F2562
MPCRSVFLQRCPGTAVGRGSRLGAGLRQDRGEQESQKSAASRRVMADPGGNEFCVLGRLRQ